VLQGQTIKKNFFKDGHILFFSNSDRDFYSKKKQCMTCVTSYKQNLKKITLHFETNDEHEKLSKFIALQCNKLTKLS
jgi:hypothetical protein